MMYKVVLIELGFILQKINNPKEGEALVSTLNEKHNYIIIIHTNTLKVEEKSLIRSIGIKSIVQIKRLEETNVANCKYDIPTFKKDIFQEARNILEQIKISDRRKQILLIAANPKLISLGRIMGIKTILNAEKNKKNLYFAKFGSTFLIKKWQEILDIIESPISKRLCLEGGKQTYKSSKSIILINNSSEGSLELVVTLGRQDVGSVDEYAQGWRYHMISNPLRNKDFLEDLGADISFYLDSISENSKYKWDYITYMSDKKSTTPPDKMKAIFELINTNIDKVTLFSWEDTKGESLRNSKTVELRRSFIDNYLILEQDNINNKNIIVIDDQITTGATAEQTIRLLKKQGANNVLFIALFLMIDDVSSNKQCPKCGLELKIKYNKKTCEKFLSCFDTRAEQHCCGYTYNLK